VRLGEERGEAAVTYTIIDVVPDTPEWGVKRLDSIGCSEVGGVIGESHFGNTPMSTFLAKIGKPRRFDPLLSLIGHGVEPLISQWVTDFHPEVGTVKPGFMARNPDYPFLHATFDRVVVAPDGVTVPLQLKSASAFSRHDWDNGPLPDYLAQEDAECLVLDNAPYALLAVWFHGSTEFQLYKLFARPDRQALIVDRARKLWYDHIVPRKPPPVTLGDDLAALYPAVEGTLINADDYTLEAVAALRETAAIRRDAVREWAAVENDMKFHIEKHMQTATELVNPYTNNRIHTWRPDKNGNRRHFSPKVKDFSS